ncbi:MAG: FadR/GntR family transcriptional regulator [Eubacteriales bacterium]|jgi:DNA-binding FadR family transcriptional regulator|nr:FadR/GntR family transcriptional regulator [Eubacteriales bacterium]
MEPIDSSSVVERIIHQITKAISTGRFRVGDRLPSEFELAEELNVGRNSLREAIKMLSTMGVVEIKRGDGTYICRQLKPTVFDSTIYSLILGESSAEELYELRRILDEDMLALAMQKCSEEDLTTLEQYIEEMRLCFYCGDLTKASKLDYEFHLYLAKCSYNSFFQRIITGVYRIFEQSIETNIRTEEQFANADAHHQKMVDCLRRKDAAHIASVVQESLSSWRGKIKTDGQKEIIPNKPA